MTTTNTSLLSAAANSVGNSITMAISAKAKAMRSEGLDVLGFSAGEPDFDTPQVVKDSGIKAIQDGETKYTPASGLIELKKAIVKKLKRDQNLDYAPDEIIVSCGAKHSLYNVMAAMINPGDEVIIPTPYWVSYPDQVLIAGGKPVFVEGKENNQFKITPEQLEQSITPKTKLFILNSPSNPTGSLYTEAELRALGQVLTAHRLHVISDEIYEKLVYEGHQHISIASLSPELKDLTLVVNGASKAYSMTGWRIGYTAGNKEIISAMGRLQSHTTSNPTTPSQWAAITAIESDDSLIEHMVAAFSERRSYMVKRLNAIPGITCNEPFGAFYAFPNISGLFGKTSPSGTLTGSLDFCERLLEDAQVACVPGAAFGAEGFVRLSYATSMDVIEKGLDRLEKWAGLLQ